MIWPYRAPGHCPSVHLTFYTDLQCTRILPFSAPGHWQSVHLVLTYNAPGLCLQCTGTSTYCTVHLDIGLQCSETLNFSAPEQCPTVHLDFPFATPRIDLRATGHWTSVHLILTFSAPGHWPTVLQDLELQCTWTLNNALHCTCTLL